MGRNWLVKLLIFPLFYTRIHIPAWNKNLKSKNFNLGVSKFRERHQGEEMARRTPGGMVRQREQEGDQSRPEGRQSVLLQW